MLCSVSYNNFSAIRFHFINISKVEIMRIAKCCTLRFIKKSQFFSYTETEGCEGDQFYNQI